LAYGDPLVGGTSKGVVAEEMKGKRFALYLFLFSHIYESRLLTLVKIEKAPIGTFHFFCGEGGIRTRDSVSTIHTFQACSFNHSDTSPSALRTAKIRFQDLPFE
jgi:hypothetical protein